MNKSNARYSSRWQQTQTKARMLYLTELAEHVCGRLVWDVFGLSQTVVVPASSSTFIQHGRLEMFHPSILLGLQGGGDYASRHSVRDRGQHRETTIHTYVARSMFWVWRRKPAYLERTHTVPGRTDFLCVSRVCLAPLDLFDPADNCCVISYSTVQFWKTSSDFSEHKHHASRGVSSSVVWLQSRTGRADAQYVTA